MKIKIDPRLMKFSEYVDENKKVLNIIFLIFLAICFLSTFFDLGVTYYFYKTTPNDFFNLEGNKCLVGEVQNNNNFFTNQSVSLSIITILAVTLFFYLGYSGIKNKIIKLFFYEITFTCLIVISILHIYGGMTWL